MGFANLGSSGWNFLNLRRQKSPESFTSKAKFVWNRYESLRIPEKRCNNHINKEIYTLIAIYGPFGSKSHFCQISPFCQKSHFCQSVKDLLRKLSILIIILALELFLIDSYRGGLLKSILIIFLVALFYIDSYRGGVRNRFL